MTFELVAKKERSLNSMMYNIQYILRPTSVE